MSHNSKYYTKRLKKEDTKKLPKITGFFSKASTSTACEPENESPTQTGEEMEMGECRSETPILVTETETETIVSESPCQSREKVEAGDSQPLSESSSEESDSTSSMPDQRKFRASNYENVFPWLYFSNCKEGFLCKYCELFASTDSNNIEFQNIGVKLGTHPTRKLKKHECSKRHIEAEKQYVKTKATDQKKTTVYDMLIKSKHESDEQNIERNRSVIKKLFKIVYFILRKKWAQANFADFVKFVAELGVEDLAVHLENAPAKATYLSGTIVSEFIDIIGEYIERKLLDNLLNCNFYTLLADESTDEANREQLSLFAKFIIGRETVSDHFLGIVNVQKTDAESLMMAIEQFLLAKQIDITKCRFVAFDGTNTMSGEVTG